MYLSYLETGRSTAEAKGQSGEYDNGYGNTLLILSLCCASATISLENEPKMCGSWKDGSFAQLRQSTKSRSLVKSSAGSSTGRRWSTTTRGQPWYTRNSGKGEHFAQWHFVDTTEMWRLLKVFLGPWSHPGSNASFRNTKWLCTAKANTLSCSWMAYKLLKFAQNSIILGFSHRIEIPIPVISTTSGRQAKSAMMLDKNSAVSREMEIDQK